MGLTDGLWSPMRGLARRQEEYYARLTDADELRQGDYGDRGALSERGLTMFARFFLEVCIDQAIFMEEMLNLSGFKNRLDALLTFEAATGGSAIRREALTALHYIAINGLLECGEFKAMTENCRTGSESPAGLWPAAFRFAQGQNLFRHPVIQPAFPFPQFMASSGSGR